MCPKAHSTTPLQSHNNGGDGGGDDDDDDDDDDWCFNGHFSR